MNEGPLVMYAFHERGGFGEVGQTVSSWTLLFCAHTSYGEMVRMAYAGPNGLLYWQCTGVPLASSRWGAVGVTHKKNEDFPLAGNLFVMKSATSLVSTVV